MATTTRQTRNKRNRSQDEETAHAETSERAEDSDNDVTPSASFITAENRNSESTELPTELGWKIYTIKENSMKMKLHADFLKTCIEEDIIPKGLTVDLTSTVEDKDNEIFNNKWKQILKNCSRELMSCLVEHYERQITLNATVIADTYESLDKIDGWTERDKQQLEEEMKLIIDDKEQKLKEAKQKKLETARRNKATVQLPRRENETYANVLKRHIHERLNPGRSERTDNTRPNKRDGQGRDNVPPRRENTWGRSPPRRENTWGRPPYPQPWYFRQYPRFLQWRPPNRSRYND